MSKQILCVEESVHVLIDETNSLIENDAQNEEFELGLATVSYTHLTLPTNREV